MFQNIFSRRTAVKRRKRENLVEYVRVGTEMLAEGDSIGAHEHFTDKSDVKQEVGIENKTGSFIHFDRLLKTEDLLKATGFLACHSSAFARIGTVTIASCGIAAEPLNTAHKNASDAVSTSLIKTLQDEAAIIAAEEWLHIVQQTTHRPLADINEAETDVAAHLDSLGINLSADFLTRYPERAQWAAQMHPERADEITEFAQSYEPACLPGPRTGGVIN